MKILAIFRHNRSGTAGYTLLEILFVLAILSLVAGLVIPRLTTLYEGMRRASERDEVLESIAGLGYWAYKQGKAFEFPAAVPKEGDFEGSEALDTLGSSPADHKPPIELPEGWRVTADEPVKYYDNGLCGGGRIHLENEGLVYTVVLSPPFCRPELLQ